MPFHKGGRDVVQLQTISFQGVSATPKLCLKPIAFYEVFFVSTDRGHSRHVTPYIFPLKDAFIW